MAAGAEIVKPLVDKREYAGFILSNGLEALCISDNVTDKAAAALDVYTGSLNDPDEVLGVAHFTEHMLFFASEKYPGESEYSKFIEGHGGFDNAYTDLENTNYQFEVNWDSLEPALDRFAQFFIQPIISADAVDREIEAVHSEHSKNVNSDLWRAVKLWTHLSSADHPWCRFTTGNIETLGDGPRKAGIEPHKAVQEYYDKYYSANLMKLVVYGREQLDDLKAMVEQKFGCVVSKDLPRKEFSGEIFTEDHLKLLVKVVPQKDVHTLQLQWAVPPNWKVYQHAPCHYASHLLGHEGKGSAFALLKRLGYATSLSAGESHLSFSGRSLFSIRVELTDLGQQNAVEVMDVIFKYIAILHGEGGVIESIFDEMKAIDETSFNFQEKSDPISYAMELANTMQLLKRRDWLRHNVPLEYNPNAIRAVLDELTPTKLRVMWSSKNFKGMTDSMEPVYGTEYSCTRIPEDWIKRWTAPEPDERLHLPEHNPFVSTNFTLLKQPDNTVPSIAFDGRILKMWHFTDTTFQVPKAQVYLRIRNPKAHNSPESAVLNRLFVQLLNDSLNEQVYPAQIAGLSYSVVNTTVGIDVTGSGYSHKLMNLVDMILDHMIGFEISDSRFQIVHEQVCREYMNKKYVQPYNRAISMFSVILEQPRWHNDMYLEVIDGITATDVASFAKDLFSRFHAVGFIIGNMSEQQARLSAENLENKFTAHLGTKEPFGPQRRWERVIKIGQGRPTLFSEPGPNPENDNSSVNIAYQIGPDNLRTNGMAQLVAHIGNKEAFDQLRTVEQLGYIVSMTSRRTLNIRTVRFILQSGKYSAAHLHARVEAFLDKLAHQLEEMDDSSFKNEVEELSKVKLEKPKRMSERALDFWQEIIDETHLFDRQAREVEELRTLTKEDLLKFFESAIHGKKSRRKLGVHVIGAAEQKGTAICDAHDPEPVNTVDDIWSFKRSQELYPCANATFVS